MNTRTSYACDSDNLACQARADDATKPLHAEIERLRSGCQFGTDGSAVAICHRLADARAERDEANRVCEQWRKWSAGDQARIAELEAALRLARVVLPAANSLPQTQTLVGDVVAAVDKALRASAPTEAVK